MMMENVKKVQARDLGKYAWSRLAQFQNVEFCTEKLIFDHKIDRRQSQNARAQAEQIKQCLAQAKEYFLAANVVSLATRPVLLYYATMSLALAEILTKQTGDSRLEKLRELHPAHGLALKLSGVPKISDGLAEAASKLNAKAQVSGDGKPMGTFEVWLRSAREYPIGGDHITYSDHGNTSRFVGVMSATNTPLPPVPKKGINLLDCIQQLPYLADALHSNGLSLSLVRGFVKAFDPFDDEKKYLEIILHPQNTDLLGKFGEACRCAPELVNGIEFREIQPSGFVATVERNSKVTLSLPKSICLDSGGVFFGCSSQLLNEFGYLYVALHICGNFARYYPDLWLRHLEKSTSLSLIIEELCNHAVERLPLLTLSELTRTYHIQAR